MRPYYLTLHLLVGLTVELVHDTKRGARFVPSGIPPGSPILPGLLLKAVSLMPPLPIWASRRLFSRRVAMIL